MPRSSRETLLRHCDRMKGNLDKALSHLQYMEKVYAKWGKELPADLKVLAMMYLAVQETIDRFADENLRA